MKLAYNWRQPVLVAILLCLSAAAAADTVTDESAELAHGWAKANYQTPEAQKDAAFGALEVRAKALVAQYPQRAEPRIWAGIITSTHAKYQGMFAAGNSATQARDELLAAQKIDPNALDGAIFTSLGALYYKVPGWPLSFGDKTKAGKLLQQGLKLDPNGIDSNFFYGDYLLQRGDKAQAKTYLTRALAAPARPDRADADAGRRGEIAALLKTL